MNNKWTWATLRQAAEEQLESDMSTEDFSKYTQMPLRPKLKEALIRVLMLDIIDPEHGLEIAQEWADAQIAQRLEEPK